MSDNDRVLEVYLFVQDTMADWEIGHIAAELSSDRRDDYGSDQDHGRTHGRSGLHGR